MENRENNRRSFIKRTALGSLMAISLPEILSAAMSHSVLEKNTLVKDNVILFQGDSITDAGRNRDDNSYNNPGILGSGYAMLAGASIIEKYASLNLKVYNKGVSGNKVFELAERWDKDCLDIKPDILSILIGVNDIWHKLQGNYNGTVEIYRSDYISLLERTKKALPNVKLIICEPFAIPGVKAVDDKWYPEFYGYQKVAMEIAAQFKATFVPYQRIFNEAITRAPAVYWTGDGVHPTLAGAQLMAQAWVDVVKA
jgi:lysophospholipase L1-like esterase